MDVRKIFQYIAMGVGALVFVVAIGLFASYKPSQSAVDAGTKANLVMWGTLPATIAQPMVTAVSAQYADLKVNYKAYTIAELPSVLTRALATGSGPDIILFDDQYIVQYYPLLQTFSYDQYPRSAYDNSYTSGAGVFALPWAIAALPVAIDPLVMYYNRDLLTAGYETVPANNWNTVLDHIKKFTTVDDNGRIEFATLPMGTIANIRHSSDILSTLIFQQLNPLVSFDRNQFVSTVRGLPGAQQSANSGISRPIDFYSAFANPNSPAYSWNSGFTDSRDTFMSEKSLYYFGLGSEYNDMRIKNPNLNIGVAIMPQIDTKITTKKATAGRIYGVGLIKNSNQKTAAYNAMQIMSNIAAGEALSGTGLVSARSELLSKPQSDPRLDTVYKSALLVRSWWNPNPVETNTLLSGLMQSVQSRSITTSDAVDRIDQYLLRTLVYARATLL
jgi:ABC-type glycerol-3-phosphate transport system substrate-binding protein